MHSERGEATRAAAPPPEAGADPGLATQRADGAAWPAGRVGHWRDRLIHATMLRDLGAVLLIFVLSRLAFYAAAAFAGGLLPESHEWCDCWVDIPRHPMLALHWRWDSIHYYTIATFGYHADPLQAFFPLLPLLIRVTATLLGGFKTPAPVVITAAPWPPLVAGVLVGHAAALLAFWLLFQLAREDTGDEDTARRTVLYAAIFPLAFFYALPYADALLLAAGAGTFLAARRGNWSRAGLWAALGAAARPQGIMLAPALGLEIALAWRRGELRRDAARRAALGLLLAPLGLVLFMLHLWERTGDPLGFIHAQTRRDLVFPLVTLGRGVAYALHPAWSPWPPLYWLGLLHTLVVLGALAILAVSFRRWRPAYVLYAVLVIALVLASPQAADRTMEAKGRYLMVLFPAFITLARWGRRPAVHQTILLLFLPLFGLLAALHVRWYFVA